MMKSHRRTRWLGLRLILVFTLGVLTTIAVSWLCSLPWNDRPSVQHLRGAAVRDDLLIQVGAIQTWRERRENWSVRDILRETWDSESVRMQAREIQVHGAAGADILAKLRSRNFAKTTPLQLLDMTRIDDYMERGPPGSFMPKDIPNHGLQLVRMKFGWPFYSMDYFYRWSLVDPRRGSPDSPTLVAELHYAIEIPRQYFDVLEGLSSGFETVTFPLGILWQGFAANLAIYASFWTLILIVPGESRRLIRLHRDRCLHCGYDLLGEYAAGCPECGWGRMVGEQADSSPASA